MLQYIRTTIVFYNVSAILFQHFGEKLQVSVILCNIITCDVTTFLQCNCKYLCYMNVDLLRSVGKYNNSQSRTQSILKRSIVSCSVRKDQWTSTVFQSSAIPISNIFGTIVVLVRAVLCHACERTNGRNRKKEILYKKVLLANLSRPVIFLVRETATKNLTKSADMLCHDGKNRAETL